MPQVQFNWEGVLDGYAKAYAEYQLPFIALAPLSRVPRKGTYWSQPEYRGVLPDDHDATGGNIGIVMGEKFNDGYLLAFQVCGLKMLSLLITLLQQHNITFLLNVGIPYRWFYHMSQQMPNNLVSDAALYDFDDSWVGYFLCKFSWTFSGWRLEDIVIENLALIGQRKYIIVPPSVDKQYAYTWWEPPKSTKENPISLNGLLKQLAYDIAEQRLVFPSSKNGFPKLWEAEVITPRIFKQFMLDLITHLGINLVETTRRLMEFKCPSTPIPERSDYVISLMKKEYPANTSFLSYGVMRELEALEKILWWWADDIEILQRFLHELREDFDMWLKCLEQRYMHWQQILKKQKEISNVNSLRSILDTFTEPLNTSE